MKQIYIPVMKNKLLYKSLVKFDNLKEHLGKSLYFIDALCYANWIKNNYDISDYWLPICGGVNFKGGLFILCKIAPSFLYSRDFSLTFYSIAVKQGESFPML